MARIIIIVIIIVIITEGRWAWCVGFLLFPRVSSFGKVMSDQC